MKKAELKEKLIKILLTENIQATFSVAKAIDEFINVDVDKEITRAKKEMLEKVKQARFELEGTEEMVKLDFILYKIDDLIKELNNYLKNN